MWFLFSSVPLVSEPVNQVSCFSHLCFLILDFKLMLVLFRLIRKLVLLMYESQVTIFIIMPPPSFQSEWQDLG